MKKGILLLMMFLLAFGAFAQENKFNLHGSVADPKLDSVSIEYISREGKYTHLIVPAPNGNFELSGHIDQPSFAFLLFKHKGEIMSKRAVELRRNLIYLEPKELSISSEGDEKGIIEVKGSKTQSEWNLLKAKTYHLQARIDSLQNLNTDGDHGQPKLNAGDRAKLAAIEKKINLDYLEFFMANPDSYVSSDRAMYLTGAFSLDTIKMIYRNFNPSVKESMGGKRLAAVIKSREVGLPGSMAFAFDILDKDGKQLSLAAFKGKYVIVDFWATWCIPCRNAMPHMVSLYQKYKDKNVAVIAIGDDDKNVAGWIAAIQKDGTGIFHHALRGANIELTRKGIPNPRDLDEQYGVHALPTQFLIDPQGEISGRFEGLDNPDEGIEKMLASEIK
jgi:thiol-disulfide isomerase/thioredoxin